MSAFSYKPFSTPWWLTNRHFQTIYGARYVPCQAIKWQRQTLTTPDQDFIDLDILDTPGATGLLVLIHGLEGNTHSRYIRSLAHYAQQHGMQVVAPNLRSCSGKINLAPRLYHAGDSQEMSWLIPSIRALYPHLPIYLVGFSLGANILLKWLSEKPSLSYVQSAVAIAPPLYLNIVANTLNQGFNRIYTHHFLSTLKPKAALKAKQFPGLIDINAIVKAKSMFEFDEHCMAPLHGFKGAEDYWQQSSAGPLLKNIALPTLIIMSEDDPFIPSYLIPNPNELSHSTEILVTSQGGHVGFVNGPFPGFLQWIPDTIFTFIRNKTL
ncbi:MAG: alpha/beta fold hydrolase [Betaproteobacteria bacterium]|nr:alpha/beta fold hydrolase [Betaproteobacteria bacterium]MDE2423756.1 alpha/beta fold hydrolase [Betaproteobacteria bacterium]